MSNLWDAILPLNRLLNLYGFRFRTGRSKGILQKLWKAAVCTGVLVILICQMAGTLFKILKIRENVKVDMAQFVLSTIANVALLNSSHYLLIYAEKDGFIGSINRLKSCPTSKICFKKIRKLATFFAVCVIIGCLLFTILMTRRLSTWTLMEYLFSRITRFLIYCIWTAMWILFFWLMSFTPLALTYPVALATYTSVSIDEKVDEVKRARSPLRRARLASRLIGHHENIEEMTARLHMFYSTHVYLLKTMAIVILAQSVMLFDIFVQTTFRPMPYVYMVVPSVFMFLLYLPKAWSANRAASVMIRCLVECELNEERNGYCFVAKMKLIRLSHVVHMRLEGGRGKWTMMGETIEGDILYQMIIDVNDMFNLIGDHHPLMPTAFHWL